MQELYQEPYGKTHIEHEKSNKGELYAHDIYKIAKNKFPDDHDLRKAFANKIERMLENGHRLYQILSTIENFGTPKKDNQ